LSIKLSQDSIGHPTGNKWELALKRTVRVNVIGSALFWSVWLYIVLNSRASMYGYGILDVWRLTFRGVAFGIGVGILTSLVGLPLSVISRGKMGGCSIWETVEDFRQSIASSPAAIVPLYLFHNYIGYPLGINYVIGAGLILGLIHAVLGSLVSAVLRPFYNWLAGVRPVCRLVK